MKQELHNNLCSTGEIIEITKAIRLGDTTIAVYDLGKMCFLLTSIRRLSATLDIVDAKNNPML